MKGNRVVITGIGAVSSIGISKDTYWDGLMAGKSGISDVSSLDVSRHRNSRGGEIKNFDPNIYIQSLQKKRYGRASQFAIAATRMALEDARVRLSELSVDAFAGIAIGTTMANIQELEQIDEMWVKYGEDFDAVHLIQSYPGNTLALDISRELGIQPRCIVIPTACAAGNYCIGYGYDLIRAGQSQLMICGGADPFSRITFTGFSSLLAMAPEKCQPFDKNRKGMLVGEGSGMLILENMDSAIQRDAHIYAEVLGYGLSCDASHMTVPSTDGIEQVMRRALIDAAIKEEDVDYISAHGTGTKANDVAECTAINRIFNNKSKAIPISSIKSMLGHTMGAASALEAIACVLAIERSRIPPTINFENADPECDIDCVPNKARQTDVRIALNNSFAFGGNNACVVLGRCEK